MFTLKLNARKLNARTYVVCHTPIKDSPHAHRLEWSQKVRWTESWLPLEEREASGELTLFDYCIIICSKLQIGNVATCKCITKV